MFGIFKRKKRSSDPIAKISIPLPLYRMTVVIFFGEEMNARVIADVGIQCGIGEEQFPSDWINEIAEAQKHQSGLCALYGEGNDDILIWMETIPKRASDFGTLYHELYHAVDFIASTKDPRNALFDQDWGSEARAYLFEYLATEANKVLWSEDRRD